jgi:hypothetical protein
MGNGESGITMEASESGMQGRQGLALFCIKPDLAFFHENPFQS